MRLLKLKLPHFLGFWVNSLAYVIGLFSLMSENQYMGGYYLN